MEKDFDKLKGFHFTHYQQVWLHGKCYKAKGRGFGRVKMIDWDRDIKGKTILDLGAANGLYTLEAARRGAKHALGVDTEISMPGANKIAELEGLKNCEFWQIDYDTQEFFDKCPDKFDVIFAFSVLSWTNFPEKFLNFIDTRCKNVLYFESNQGEFRKKQIEAIKERTSFKFCEYKGPSGSKIEGTHHLWRCVRNKDDV